MAPPLGSLNLQSHIGKNLNKNLVWNYKALTFVILYVALADGSL